MHLIAIISILLIILPLMAIDSLNAARVRRRPKKPLSLVWTLSSDTLPRQAKRRPYRSNLHQIVMPLCSA